MATYIRRAIVVTGPTEFVERARDHALSLGLTVTSLAMGRNGADTFTIAPLGSGEEYPAAAEERSAHERMIEYLGPRIALDWVAVQFGRENGRAKLVADCGSAESRAALRWGK